MVERKIFRVLDFQTNTAEVVILYPAFITPALLFGTGPQQVELLIAVQSGVEVTPEIVNLHLKIVKGMETAKTNTSGVLTGDVSQIVVLKIDKTTDDIFTTQTRFSGYFDSRFLEALNSENYTVFYSITIQDYTFDSSGVGTDLFNCIWVDATMKKGKIEGHDRVIDSVVTALHGDKPGHVEKDCYIVGTSDIDYTKTDSNNPLQSYHPIFLFPDASKSMNIGLIGDLHCSSRQNILEKSKARVIDYDCTEDSYFPAPGTDKTPTGIKSKAPDPIPGSEPEPAPAPVPGYDLYVVQSGDWLEKIAKRYGMTWKELWNYDGGTGIPNSKRLKSGNPDLIYPGEEIVVPGSTDPIPPVAAKKLRLSHDVLVYTMYEGGEEPPELTIDITSEDPACPIPFSVYPQETWMDLPADSLHGTTPKTIPIKVKSTGLSPGSYSGNIEVASGDAANSPQNIRVSFTIYDETITEDSPEIGPMFNVASKNFKELLDKMGLDHEIDIVVIAGDIIDFNQNCFPSGTTTYDTQKKVWDHVAMTGENTERQYYPYVDHVGCFSLFTHFYQTYEKPIFIVSGNHDPYERPWGISPRATIFGIRANAGVPADSNLTFYEAILIFGETYHENPGMGNLVPAYFKWFYTLYTPFSDYIIDLPKQTLIGLAWGDDEDIIDIPAVGQGWGHLPRAQEAITDKQLSLIEKGIGFGKKVFLATHFTFASYLENIPLDTGVSQEGRIEYVEIETAASGINEFMMGTFEVNRERMIKEHCFQQRDIACIITGHSHRRGCYQVTGINEGDEYVTTRFYDIPAYASLSGKTEPVIVVCDSGGNLPRFNQSGEFGGWGSDRSGGIKIICDGTGAVASLATIPVGPKPRFVVALDYKDIFVEEEVIVKFETDTFRIAEEDADLVDYSFELLMRSDVTGIVFVNAITLYCYANDHTWKRVALQYNPTTKRWIIRRGPDAVAFRQFFVPNDDRSHFMSIRFSPKSPLVGHYDFSTAWNFEFQIDSDTSGGGIFGAATDKKYVFERDSDHAEVPDFDWRKKLMKYKDTFGT